MERIPCRKYPPVEEVRQSAPGEEIVTPKGRVVTGPGDLIVKGANGEEKAMKPETFDAEYERLNAGGRVA